MTEEALPAPAAEPSELEQVKAECAAILAQIGALGLQFNLNPDGVEVVTTLNGLISMLVRKGVCTDDELALAIAEQRRAMLRNALVGAQRLQAERAKPKLALPPSAQPRQPRGKGIQLLRDQRMDD